MKINNVFGICFISLVSTFHKQPLICLQYTWVFVDVWCGLRVHTPECDAPKKTTFLVSLRVTKILDELPFFG